MSELLGDFLDQLKFEDPRLRRFAMLAFACAAATILAFPAAGGAATKLYLRGAVVCPKNAPVVGVWVASSGGGSGWAAYTAYPGTKYAARFSRTFVSNLSTKVSLSIGCGGKPSKWGTTTKTGALTVKTGTLIYFNVHCSTSTKRCTTPPLENDTPKASRTVNSVGAAYADQCTYRAAEFWKVMTGRYPNWSGNAYQWAGNAKATGWQLESFATPDSIAVTPSSAASSFGHVAYVADVRVASGKVQLKIYDRNFDFHGHDRNAVWVDTKPGMRFISAPARVDKRLW